MTFARRNRLTTHFSESIPVVKGRITVLLLSVLWSCGQKEIQQRLKKERLKQRWKGDLEAGTYFKLPNPQKEKEEMR
jgi:hypothetical protein